MLHQKKQIVLWEKLKEEQRRILPFMHSEILQLVKNYAIVSKSTLTWWMPPHTLFLVQGNGTPFIIYPKLSTIIFPSWFWFFHLLSTNKMMLECNTGTCTHHCNWWNVVYAFYAF